MSFEFDLKSKVKITTSDEAGEVVGRAEYPASPNSYLIRYKAADGRAVKIWWDENSLEAA